MDDQDPCTPMSPAFYRSLLEDAIWRNLLSIPQSLLRALQRRDRGRPEGAPGWGLPDDRVILLRARLDHPHLTLPQDAYQKYLEDWAVDKLRNPEGKLASHITIGLANGAYRKLTCSQEQFYVEIHMHDAAVWDSCWVPWEALDLFIDRGVNWCLHLKPEPETIREYGPSDDGTLQEKEGPPIPGHDGLTDEETMRILQTLDPKKTQLQ